MGLWDFVKGLFGGGGQPPAPGRQPPAAGGGPSDPWTPGADETDFSGVMPPDADGAPSRPRNIDGQPSPLAAAANAVAAAVAKARGGDAKKKPGGPRSWAPPDILGLSPAELRKRALKIRPWATAWIGRTDTIPPESDERTALIDRGLELAGKLTRAELTEIHEVGDLWLQHKKTIDFANEAGQRSAREALEARKADRAARKAEKQRASAEKKRLRAEGVAHRKRTDVVFLGRGVSKGLADRRSNVEKLTALGLPVLSTPADVAEHLGLSIPRLRWLAFHTEAAERTHYVYFEIPKRSGGTRLLAAPHAELKAAQAKILETILAKLDPGEYAHGFVPGRSTVSNARAHVGRRDVVNLDIRDFFPTIGWRRVRGLFKGMGYSPAVATILALLTTEAPRVPVEYDGKRWMVAVGERALPQGAPTSPALSNLVARRLDKRLAGLARSAGWTYTRYADDLTFSSSEDGRRQVPWLMRQVSAILEKEGFHVHPQKRRVQRSGGRQEVTGVVVNQQLGVPREEVRRLRAILHGAKATGLEAQNKEGRAHFAAWLRGKIAYVHMIDPAKGAKLLAELDAIEGKAPRA